MQSYNSTLVILWVICLSHLTLNNSQAITTGSSIFNNNRSLAEWLMTDGLAARANRLMLQQMPTNSIAMEPEQVINGKSEAIASNTGPDFEPPSCQLVKVVLVLQKPGCLPKAISSYACTGSCPSYVQVSKSKDWKHERSCSCCQQTEVQEDTFVLDCPALTPQYREVKTYAPVNCICRSCSDMSRENIRPQELVEALEGQSTGF